MKLYKKQNQKFKNTTVLFFSFETITLKLYLEIVKSLDLKKLVAVGTASIEECQQQWDRIIQRCSEANGGLDYVGFIDLSQAYGLLLTEYNIIKCWLTKLFFKIDDEIIEQLAQRGYNIITTKEHTGYNPDLLVPPNSNILSENYRQSLMTALHRSEHLVTKLKMKSNELRLMLGGNTGGRKEMLFDEIMAHLQVRGLKVEDDIKLSRYIELLKIFKTSSKEENIYG